MADAPATSERDETYQSLYRRYRPQRFDEVRGQDHVTRALRNAVRDDRVAHAYLFSGPRGTGKTSTARILAMALNCAHPVDGEPDGTCASCVDIRRGASMDVHELDAASNRKLDEMRDLLSRVALGTRSRWKVYIIDEVHQLTSDAASALLKTLEEPPGHVVFVLATTDPQKVLPTIRSRTQHFEFRLLGPDVLGGLLHDVNERAGLGLASEAIDLVVRRGHGSARDALSVLDQVAAAGEVEDESGPVEGIIDALADQDAGRVLLAVAEAMSAGRDPRRLAADLLEHLRNGFLATEARALVHLSDDAVVVVEEQARRLGLAAVVMAMEVVGQAAVDMRDSVDPRVTLEAALVRLASPRADRSTGALLRRLELLESQVAALTASGPALPAPGVAAPSRPVPAARPEWLGGAAPGQPASGAPPQLPAREPPPARSLVGEPAPAGPQTPAGPPPGAGRSGPTRPGRPPATGGPAADGDRDGPPGGSRGSASPATRPALGAHRRGLAPSGPASPARPPEALAQHSEPPRRHPEPPEGAGPREGPPPSGAPAPSRDELTKAWGDAILPSLRPALKAYISAGRFVAVDGPVAVYVVPDEGLLARAQPLRGEMEQALGAHFGRPVPVRLVIDRGSIPAPVGPPDMGGRAAGGEDDDGDVTMYDLDELADAGPAVVSPEQRLLEAFPGAEEVTP